MLPLNKTGSLLGRFTEDTLSLTLGAVSEETAFEMAYWCILTFLAYLQVLLGLFSFTWILVMDLAWRVLRIYKNLFCVRICSVGFFGVTRSEDGYNSSQCSINSVSSQTSFRFDPLYELTYNAGMCCATHAFRNCVLLSRLCSLLNFNPIVFSSAYQPD